MITYLSVLIKKLSEIISIVPFDRSLRH